MTAKRAPSRTTLFDILKDNPMASIATTVGAIVVILGAIFGLDERYAHAGDLKQLGVQMELNALEARNNTLKDRVFDLQQKKRTPADQASLSRYENEQKDVDRQLLQKRQLLDQMKNGR